MNCVVDQTNRRDTAIENEVLVKPFLLFLNVCTSTIRKLTHFIKPRPIKIERYGKTFFVSGNLEYLLFWRLKSWERETYRIFNKFLDSNNSYIDIGAWIGPTVLYGSQIAKKVYAIEPDPIAYKELEKNISLNPELKEKIELHEKCINTLSGKVKFGSMLKGGDSMSSLLFTDSKTKWIVDGITFDEFIKINKVNDCNFIKMDIEGAEEVILPTMKNYLMKKKPTLYLSIHPRFFKNPEITTRKIFNDLLIYKNLYIHEGKKIGLEDMLSRSRLKSQYKLKASYGVVATDQEWN
jgi:FkbM family methyltransferase